MSASVPPPPPSPPPATMIPKWYQRSFAGLAGSAVDFFGEVVLQLKNGDKFRVAVVSEGMLFLAKPDGQIKSNYEVDEVRSVAVRGDTTVVSMADGKTLRIKTNGPALKNSLEKARIGIAEQRYKDTSRAVRKGKKKKKKSPSKAHHDMAPPLGTPADGGGYSVQQHQQPRAPSVGGFASPSGPYADVAAPASPAYVASDRICTACDDGGDEYAVALYVCHVCDEKFCPACWDAAHPPANPRRAAHPRELLVFKCERCELRPAAAGSIVGVCEVCAEDMPPLPEYDLVAYDTLPPGGYPPPHCGGSTPPAAAASASGSPRRSHPSHHDPPALAPVVVPASLTPDMPSPSPSQHARSVTPPAPVVPPPMVPLPPPVAGAPPPRVVVLNGVEFIECPGHFMSKGGDLFAPMALTPAAALRLAASDARCVGITYRGGAGVGGGVVPAHSLLTPPASPEGGDEATAHEEHPTVHVFFKTQCGRLHAGASWCTYVKRAPPMPAPAPALRFHPQPPPGVQLQPPFSPSPQRTEYSEAVHTPLVYEPHLSMATTLPPVAGDRDAAQVEAFDVDVDAAAQASMQTLPAGAAAESPETPATAQPMRSSFLPSAFDNPSAASCSTVRRGLLVACDNHAQAIHGCGAWRYPPPEAPRTDGLWRPQPPAHLQAHIPSHRVLRMLEGWMRDHGARGDVRVLSDHNPDAAPSKDNILASLRWLARSARPGDSLFFSFVGHGASRSLIPCDFPTAGYVSGADFQTHVLRGLPGGTSVVVLADFCAGGRLLDLPYTAAIGSDVAGDACVAPPVITSTAVTAGDARGGGLPAGAFPPGIPLSPQRQREHHQRAADTDPSRVAVVQLSGALRGPQSFAPGDVTVAFISALERLTTASPTFEQLLRGAWEEYMRLQPTGGGPPQPHTPLPQLVISSNRPFHLQDAVQLAPRVVHPFDAPAAADVRERQMLRDIVRCCDRDGDGFLGYFDLCVLCRKIATPPITRAAYENLCRYCGVLTGLGEPHLRQVYRELHPPGTLRQHHTLICGLPGSDFDAVDGDVRGLDDFTPLPPPAGSPGAGSTPDADDGSRRGDEEGGAADENVGGDGPEAAATAPATGDARGDVSEDDDGRGASDNTGGDTPTATAVDAPTGEDSPVGDADGADRGATPAEADPGNGATPPPLQAGALDGDDAIGTPQARPVDAGDAPGDVGAPAAATQADEDEVPQAGAPDDDANAAGSPSPRGADGGVDAPVQGDAVPTPTDAADATPLAGPAAKPPKGKGKPKVKKKK